MSSDFMIRMIETDQVMGDFHGIVDQDEDIPCMNEGRINAYTSVAWLLGAPRRHSHCSTKLSHQLLGVVRLWSM